jgi:hypothetical protein
MRNPKKILQGLCRHFEKYGTAMKTIDGKDFNPSLPYVLLQIAERIREASGKAYLVGGWVRDAMLGRECRDFDVEVYGINQEQLLKILSRFGRPQSCGKGLWSHSSYESWTRS